MYINEVFFIEYAAIDDNLLWNYYDSAILWWRSIILTFIICPIDVMCYAVLCQDCWSYLKMLKYFYLIHRNDCGYVGDWSWGHDD